MIGPLIFDLNQDIRLFAVNRFVNDGEVLRWRSG
ncbi:MAG: hypothetical protein QOF73_4753 [Thermomicrobiales bacterium]|jgi:hypothetical protein|nr:hypothetical protein [Thermomicrobiales bacterium]